MVEIKNNKLVGLKKSELNKLHKEILGIEKDLSYKKRRLKILTILGYLKKYKVTINKKYGDIHFAKKSIFGHIVDVRISINFMERIKKGDFREGFIDLVIGNKFIDLVGYNGIVQELLITAEKGKLK